jgi:quinol monooxygenase YgiN
MTLHVVAHLYASPGNEDFVREVLEGFVGPTRQENGCLRYELFADISDPTRFTFIEEWTGVEALEAHSRSEHIAAGRAKLDGKLAQPGWVQRLYPVNDRPVNHRDRSEA